MPLPIVFINLVRDRERRARIESEAHRLGLAIERIDAVWWADLSHEDQQFLYSKSLNEKQYYQPLVAGEKGCYASHRVAWQLLLERNAPAMVILEDDIRLDDRFAEVMEAIDQLRQPWDMIKLIGRDQEKLRASRPLTTSTRLVEYSRVPSATAGYVVSRAGAIKLLEKRQPFGRPIDVDLRFWWECDLRVLGVVPSVLHLDETSFVSSIGYKPAPANLGTRWRKFRMKFKLTFWNSWHGIRRRCSIAL